MVLQNLYEPLLWYNGTSPTVVIPWLAQNYTASANGMTYNFTLRSGIQFGDGETLNSTAVYFSLNRLLMGDGSTPTTHATQAAWLLQQLVNTSLSTYLSHSQTYTPTYAYDVLAQDFVQITGPLTFTIHVMNPSSSFPYLLTGLWAYIMAPDYVMQKDLAAWTQSSVGYTLPYPSPSGNATTMINEYLDDLAATCNSGATPTGCGQSYLFSPTGSVLAGTGPYVLTSYSAATNDFVLTANPNYWGGPYQYMGGQKVTPQITTININYVPSEQTREIDLENAAKSGQAYTIDVDAGDIYDLVSRSAWLTNGTIQPIVSGITIYGPYSQFATSYEQFASNVTSASTGDYYTFQPFADIRLREAFADSVNMTEINIDVNNNLGQVANELIPPDIPPTGSYNASIPTYFSFNTTAVQDLLLSAMETPITHFTFFNGTTAPAGVFNNTFGCSEAALSANSGTCSRPVPQTIDAYYPSGDTVDGDIMTQIATVVNNVSSTYNMGLTVDVVPEPEGQMFTYAFSDHLALSWSGYVDDYPWAGDFIGGELGGGGQQPAFYGWNYTSLHTLYTEVLQDQASGNNTALVSAINEAALTMNQEVLQLWTFYPLTVNGGSSSVIAPFTSNVQGYFYNPSLYGTYFATLYVT